MQSLLKVNNLNEARDKLQHLNERVVLINPEGSSKYLGILLIDYIFKTLSKEFPEKISSVIINAENDKAAYFTALKLGYTNIIY